MPRMEHATITHANAARTRLDGGIVARLPIKTPLWSGKAWPAPASPTLHAAQHQLPTAVMHPGAAAQKETLRLIVVYSILSSWEQDMRDGDTRRHLGSSILAPWVSVFAIRRACRSTIPQFAVSLCARPGKRLLDSSGRFVAAMSYNRVVTQTNIHSRNQAEGHLPNSVSGMTAEQRDNCGGCLSFRHFPHRLMIAPLSLWEVIMQKGIDKVRFELTSAIGVNTY